jgi:hypothetical protein
MIAPCYFIIAGVKENEGAIISRDRFTAANVTSLSNETWYIVQTNEDHFDGICLQRCAAARKNLDTLTQANLNAETGFNQVLNVPPNLNKASIYSAMMNPSNGLLSVKTPTSSFVASDF